MTRWGGVALFWYRELCDRGAHKRGVGNQINVDIELEEACVTCDPNSCCCVALVGETAW